jgi:hypothetical protein
VISTAHTKSVEARAVESDRKFVDDVFVDDAFVDDAFVDDVFVDDVFVDDVFVDDVFVDDVFVDDVFVDDVFVDDVFGVVGIVTPFESARGQEVLADETSTRRTTTRTARRLSWWSQTHCRKPARHKHLPVLARRQAQNHQPLRRGCLRAHR